MCMCMCVCVCVNMRKYVYILDIYIFTYTCIHMFNHIFCIPVGLDPVQFFTNLFVILL